MLDPELVQKIKSLRLEFKDRQQPELLIKIPNNLSKNEVVIHRTEEFTSLCPLNPSQPDYATIEIAFKPITSLVELKSLKLYLVSYRMVRVFHEDVPRLVLNDLLPILGDIELGVKGRFSTRGGLYSTVVSYNGMENYRWLMNQA